jgi:hypothetical protein
MVAMLTIEHLIDQTLPIYFGLGSGKVRDNHTGYPSLTHQLEIIKAIVKYIAALIIPNRITSVDYHRTLPWSCR